MEEDMFCYIHEGGQLVKCVGGSVQYQGGRSESMVVSRHMSHSDFVSKLCDALHFDQNSIKLEFTVKFEPSCLLPLHDDAALLKMFRFNEMFCHVYVSSSSEVVEGCIAPNSAPSPIVGSNSAHLLPSGGDLPINICNDSLTIESYGFSHRCAEANILERDSRRFENSIMGSGHTFSNAAEFRDVVYLMSIAGRFRYRFKRNSTKHMTVVCTITQCPWKVTARAIGVSNIVQVHTFHNHHNHSLENVAACKPLVRSNRASLLIDDVIRSTPDYQPRQIYLPLYCYCYGDAPFTISWCIIFLTTSLLTPKDVREVLGIPNNGVDILIYKRRGTPNRTYDIKILEANLRDLPVGEEFMKSFLIFACATILVPNSKQEGMHDLWDTDGIRDYRTSHPTYIRGCVLFLQFYMTAFQVEVRSPLSAAWTDEQVKRRLAAEIHTYGNYGHVQVIQGSKPSAHNDGHPYEAVTHTDDPTETIEAWLSRNSEHLMSLASSVAQDIATLRARSSGGQSGYALTPPQEAVNVERKKDEGSTGVHPCAASTHSGQQRVIDAAVDDGPCIDHDTFPPSQKSVELQSLKGVQIGVQEGCGSKEPSPTPRRRVKHIAKRLVKPAAICKSPFVSQCVQLFPKISQQERLVADYALSEDGEPSEILCDMHGTYITRDELSSLNGGPWVNSAIIGLVCRMMNAKQVIPPRAHYFDPSFSVVLAITPKAKKHEIKERCWMFFHAEFVGHDFSSCDMLFFPVCDNNHWHVHVVNIPASRVEILSLLPLRRGNGISVVSRRLSDAIDQAFHAHGMLRRVEVSKFQHVQPQIVQQLNGYDCGMFAIKYMEHWNGATLAHSIAEVSISMRLIVTLVTNAANNARDKLKRLLHDLFAGVNSKRAMKYEKLLARLKKLISIRYYLAKLIQLYERMVELPRIAGFFIPLLKKGSMEYARSGVAGSILAIICCGGSLFIYPKFSSRSVYQRFMEVIRPSREHDRTPRCCSYERMEPRDTRYVALNEGRKLCLECLDSAIMDTNEFPLLLVERQALNEAMEGEKSGHHHMPETRGLCLSEEQTVSTILRRPKIGTGNRVMNMITEPCKLTRRCDVTAILILYGLPSNSTQQPLNADLLAFLLQSQSLLTSCLEDYWAAYDRSGYDNADFSSSQLQKIAERNALHQTQSTGTKDTTSSSLTLDAQQKVTDLMARRNPGKIPHSGNKLRYKSSVSVVGHAAILAAIKKYMPSLDCTLSCTMNGHKSVVSALAVSDGVLYSGSWDGTIRLWSLNDHSPLTVLGEDTRGNVISVLSLKADHHMLLAAHEDGYLKYYKVTGQEGIGIYQIANAFMEMVVHRRLGQECQCTAGDDLQIEALPVGFIASDSAVTALLYWQGKLFVGCVDRIIKEQDKRIEELTAELENASQMCEAYRASLLAALKDMEGEKLKMAMKFQNTRLNLKG
ncbi:hypothetical protein AAG906_038434 [Vitis piasezkii]